MTNPRIVRRLGLIGVALSTIALVGLAFVATRDSNAASTACSTPTLNFNVASMMCGSVKASWAVGTSLPATTTSTGAPTTTSTTVAPTTSTTSPNTTTSAAPATTTTTTVPTQLTCAAFVDPTNTFHLNDGVQGSNLINTNTPVFTLAADGPLAQYTVKVDDSILPGVYRNYTSSTTCVKVPTGMLTDGAHTISAVEIAPNPQQVAPYNFVTDTTPPTPPTITSATFSSGFVRMSGTGLALFTVKSCEGFLCNGGAAVGTTGLWSIATSKPSGTHQLYVVQMDKAGNVSSPSNIVTVVVP